ncbi:hypothetical protein [Oceanotoga teriensis]|uniref:hypothetical protein n=1 Tax=Oceanotoga teriensis TaxID=515440 RepID=UPI0027127B13|nr:hypothetical protein [Oceanotoga teriensis]MDO7976612.1 hypothetical protein [Oceanotoga teriensis]
MILIKKRKDILKNLQIKFDNGIQNYILVQEIKNILLFYDIKMTKISEKMLINKNYCKNDSIKAYYNLAVSLYKESNFYAEFNNNKTFIDLNKLNYIDKTLENIPQKLNCDILNEKNDKELFLKKLKIISDEKNIIDFILLSYIITLYYNPYKDRSIMIMNIFINSILYSKGYTSVYLNLKNKKNVFKNLNEIIKNLKNNDENILEIKELPEYKTLKNELYYTLINSLNHFICSFEKEFICIDDFGLDENFKNSDLKELFNNGFFIGFPKNKSIKLSKKYISLFHKEIEEIQQNSNLLNFKNFQKAFEKSLEICLKNNYNILDLAVENKNILKELNLKELNKKSLIENGYAVINKNGKKLKINTISKRSNKHSSKMVLSYKVSPTYLSRIKKYYSNIVLIPKNIDEEDNSLFLNNF